MRVRLPGPLERDIRMLPFEEQAALFYRLVVAHAGQPIWMSHPGYPDPASIAVTRVEQIAILLCPTGSIIACDPSYSPSSCDPFTDQLPQGEWPLFLCGVRLTSAENTPFWYPIGSYLQFRSQTPQRWRLALCADQRMEDLAADEFWGFGVDGGRACFMDAAALLPWDQLKRSPAYRQQPAEPLDYTPPRIEDVRVPLEDGGEANVVSFQAGYGDGAYPCFIGETVTGEICVLLMMFDVFDTDANAEDPITP